MANSKLKDVVTEWIFQVTISENKALESTGPIIIFLGVPMKWHPIKRNPQLSCLRSFYVGQAFSHQDTLALLFIFY